MATTKKLEERITRLARENEMVRNINRQLILRAEKLEKALGVAERALKKAGSFMGRPPIS